MILGEIVVDLFDLLGFGVILAVSICVLVGVAWDAIKRRFKRGDQ